MEELSVFICGRCHWECGRAQAAASAPLEVKLWQDISASKDVALVTCPQCRAELIQCCHCPLNFCKADPETQRTITERKQSILALGKEHVNSSHNKVDNVSKSRQTKKKRRRISAGRRGIGAGHEGKKPSPKECYVTDNSNNEFNSFTCCRCSHVCSRGDIDERAQAAWDLMLTQGNNVAPVVCPSCNQKIIQCCKCPHNINPDDPSTKEICNKERRSATSLLYKRHVRFEHPCLLNEDKDCTDFGGTGGGGAWDIDEADTDFHVEGQDQTGNMNEDAPPNNGEMDDSRHSFESSVSRNTDSNLDLGVNLRDVFDNYSTSEEECLSDDDAPHDHEAELAQKYVDLFAHLNLDPNMESEQENEHAPPQDVLQEADATGRLTYEDFIMFDNRLDKDKYFKNSKRKRICQNQLYMYQSYLSSAGGFRGLVGRSNKHNREDISASVDVKEAIVVFLMFKLVMDMTQTQQSDLARYHNKLLQHLKVGEINNTSSTRIPVTMADLRTQITIGGNSILKNFPSPRVFDIGPHACVGLKEAILLLLGHGGTPNFGKENGERNLEGLNGTKAMDDLINEVEKKMKDSGIFEGIRNKTKIGHLIFWSDSFLRCFIKQKENSVWVLTVTVCPPEDKKSSGNYTIILAIGKSGEDHTEVVKNFMKQAEELMEGFDCYFDSTKSIERVAFGILAWCADRPEMQALTHTLKEGTYGKVFGWSVNPSEEFLPACVRCYKALIERMLGGECSESDNTCNSCCNWSFETDPSKINEDGQVVHLQKTDPGPENYPRSYPESLDGDKSIPPMPVGRSVELSHLPPVRLSTKWMQDAVTSGYFGVRVGKWSKGSAEEYFRTCNINKATGDQVIEKALEDKESNVIDPDSVQPKFWQLVECFGPKGKFPVLPMHGIAHGMGPDVLDVLMRIFTKYKKKQKFYDYANPIIKQVEIMHLDYCKVKQLPKAAWVSEHSMGFIRLMPYLIGTFLMNNPLGNSDEAKEITLYIKCMVNAFHAYVSILMSDTPVDRNILDSHIKLFMSSAHYLHKKHGKLDATKKNISGPRQGSDSRLKYLDRQHISVLQAIAKELGVTCDGGKDALIRKISAITKVVLQGVLGMSDEDASKLSKDDMYKVLYERIVNNAEEAESGQKKSNAQSEKMCWNCGYWLSFMAKITEQIEYLGVLRLIWEGRHERQIDRVKDVLVSMRKDQTYRKTKMLLLQKLAGIELLRDLFDELDEDVAATAPRDWFKGLHRYESQECIIRSFVQGTTPLSCFRSKTCQDTFHVAYYGGDHSLIKLITMKCRRTIMTAQESGLHFCKFVLAKEEGNERTAVKVVTKEELSGLIGDYALLLPYSKKDEEFQNQFTVCYSDWHVLRCRCMGPTKGFPQPDKDVFVPELIESLTNLSL